LLSANLCHANLTNVIIDDTTKINEYTRIIRATISKNVEEYFKGCKYYEQANFI